MWKFKNYFIIESRVFYFFLPTVFSIITYPIFNVFTQYILLAFAFLGIISAVTICIVCIINDKINKL